ncbi:sigma-70 family RNA polymerase sigma factor [Evansella sp. AB-rgal1]|uniref:sigma-70 family RNA polymerase sigma factor n=1 Tax=Evansella sp. AB-rgal1 TaxID=3242696 RepID=UPI00359E9AA0
MNISKEVKRAQRGKVSSFEKLVTSHQLILYRIARTILSRNEDCADAIQETIVKAFEKLSSLREPQYFKTWIIRILMNECYQIVRKRKNIVPFEDWKETSSLEKGYESIEVEELLSVLPHEQQELIKLYHIEDISIQDLSSIYEVPENTVKTRLRRAREKMREILEQEDEVQWKNGKIK